VKEVEKHGSKENLVSIPGCNLCGSSGFTTEITSGNFQFLKCLNCGLVFRSQIPTQENLNVFYQKEYYQKAQPYLDSQLHFPSNEYYLLGKKLMRFFKPTSSSEKPKSLDIGCGAGSAVAAFKAVGWESLGIDLSMNSVIAGKKLGRNLYCTSIENQDLGIFDALTAFHVLEHVSSPKSFLIECQNKLAANGLLLIEVPNFGSRRAIKMGEKWPYLYPDLHFYQFTEITLSKYLCNMHFKILEVRRLSGKGPLEETSGQGKFNCKAKNILKDLLFLSRHLVWALPGAKRLMRNIIWERLQYGEFLQVLARKQ